MPKVTQLKENSTSLAGQETEVSPLQNRAFLSELNQLISAPDLCRERDEAVNAVLEGTY